MQDYGELGFWLAAGIVLAAWILSNGQKEREKERQKQETRRALLTAEGKNPTEILAYLRETDAAEEKREGDLRVARNRIVRKVLAALGAFMAGISSFLACVALLNRLFHGASGQGQPWPVVVGLILGPLAVGAFFAFLVYGLVRGKKNVPPPGP